ncbi:CoA transferase, partial [Bradyrhizobium sp. 33ap4]|uniref:CoA transferase n=1 Tax=Bradyrhizobium sp. 33ap4 TaxID=3061630 RepID=UPI002931A4D8
MEIEKIGESAPIPLPSGDRPLTGLRVLDFAHVLAGPVTSRMLAEQGADVLRITGPGHHDGWDTALDTGVGKRSADLDLEVLADVERAKELMRSADVFVQSWRPGSLDRRGFSPEELSELRPGLIYVSVSAYGSGGPWAERGGFNQVG